MMGLTPSLWHAAFWAGLIAIDITGCGPWMVSQPMIAGSIFGWLMGQVNVGVILGGVIQLLWMDISPIGVGIPFDATATTILAVYWATLKPTATLPDMVLALLFAVPFGYICRTMDHYSRRLNTWAVRKLESVSDSLLNQTLTLSILAGLIWIWVRYTLFYVLCMALGQWGWNWLQLHPLPDWINQGLTTAAYLSPIAGLGVSLELFLSEEPERRFPSMRAFKSKG
jgi:mannose/fructose/N-acetylgalactosamine-specific phosphotransferase system component IIC